MKQTEFSSFEDLLKYVRMNSKEVTLVKSNLNTEEKENVRRIRNYTFKLKRKL